jgi:hypothetical protein
MIPLLILDRLVTVLAASLEKSNANGILILEKLKITKEEAEGAEDIFQYRMYFSTFKVWLEKICENATNKKPEKIEDTDSIALR